MGWNTSTGLYTTRGITILIVAYNTIHDIIHNLNELNKKNTKATSNFCLS